MGLVYGVGLYEKGRYPASINNKLTKPYKLWTSMLHRCYSSLSLELKPTYGAVTVSLQFLEFQRFAEWLDSNYVSGWSLDKDILAPGNKVYCAERCCFVPMIINTQLNHNRVSRGPWPTGVTQCSTGKFLPKLSVRGRTLNLGRFDTPEAAREVYLQSKRKYLDELANQYREQMPDRVYAALLKFPIEEDFNGIA
jgi:hypothetical protein